MRLSIPTRLLGTVTAAAIALTSFSAVPAHADDERVARAIATILGIAAIGAIIHENRKDDKRQKVYRQQQVHKHKQVQKPRYVQPRAYQPRRVQPHGYVQPRPLPQRIDRALLPQNCLRSYNTRNGQAHMFGQRCLERNYRAVHRLPQQCAIRIRTYEGSRAGYDARCLHRSGYRLGRG